MTTTSQQPPTGEPVPGDRGSARRAGLLAAAVVALAAVAVLVWVFVAGPLSGTARTERDIEQTITDLESSETLADFNGHLCAEQRMPQSMIDAIAGSGDQTGVDLDAMFREQVMGTFPENLEVTDVTVDGENATATVESSAEDAPAEQLQLRREDGTWTVCEPRVGMGAVPSAQQGGN